MITIKVKEVKTRFEGAKGLLFEKNPKPLFLKTRFGIHTFGMQFPIDVVILDNTYQIVAYKENLKPGKVFVWNPKYSLVLELPNGTIAEKKITKGIKIKLLFV